MRERLSIVSQGNQGRAVREGRNVKAEICSLLAVCRWGEKKCISSILGLVGVNGKNVTALMGFGTESYLILYL